MKYVPMDDCQIPHAPRTSAPGNRTIASTTGDASGSIGPRPAGPSNVEITDYH
jgi:hypothetical protein